MEYEYVPVRHDYLLELQNKEKDLAQAIKDIVWLKNLIQFTNEARDTLITERDNFQALYETEQIAHDATKERLAAYIDTSDKLIDYRDELKVQVQKLKNQLVDAAVKNGELQERVDTLSEYNQALRDYDDARTDDIMGLYATTSDLRWTIRHWTVEHNSVLAKHQELKNALRTLSE